MRFDGQVGLVVGAGPGLGSCLAARFVQSGGQVALAARSSRSLSTSTEAARKAGGEPLALEVDVVSIDSARRMAEAVIDRFGRIDILVNNAFDPPRRRTLLEMQEEDLADWRRTTEIGGYGTLLACRFTVPHMVAAGSGSIVNMTSLSSRAGMPGRSDFSAGKAQAHKLAQSLASELGPHGIRVNCVAPGPIWSAQLERHYRAESERTGVPYRDVVAQAAGETALRRIPREDEIANAVLFLSSELSSGITGAVIDVNAGLYATP
jgi:NAD(P)-dependent dehydrogenase (short-subunit alcohol dehydrogenase family)